MMSRVFWHGKSVLVTGHTGFKGSWLVLWLRQLGATLCGVALPPATAPNLFELTRLTEGIDSYFCDVRDTERLVDLVRACRPEIVFHMAAQPLVRASYRDPLGTFASNIMGTAHVLDALRGLNSVRVAVMVSTDKVYRNLEHPRPYHEDCALGGHDPYSASKAASEIVIASYRDAFLKEQGVAVASARAGNVIGGGDWSTDRLIPDAVRAWQGQRQLEIRSPQATRPWQHVLDALHGYLTLAEKLWYRPALAGAYNFGPHPQEAATVKEVVELARAAYGNGNVSYGDDNTGPYEAGWLALETSKTRMELNVQQRWGLGETITRTMAWYQSHTAGADARNLCLEELANYQSISQPPTQA